MAKSGQYTRGKRLAMQVTLALVLAGTIGLAALVSRNQSHEGDVELDRGRRVGRLIVRLPVGWAVEPVTSPEAGTTAVLAAGPAGRSVAVVQTKAAAGGAGGPAPFVEMEAKGSVRRRVEMLGRVGYVVEHGEVPVGVYEDGGTVRGYILYAGTVLPPEEGAPPGSDALGVMVIVTGPGSLGPSAKRLLHAVAENLAEAPPDGPGAETAPATTPATSPTSPATVPSTEPADAAPESRLIVSPESNKDAVEVRAASDAAVLHVTSPGGIGRAQVRSENGRWPARVVVRLLQFKSLERFGAAGLARRRGRRAQHSMDRRLPGLTGGGGRPWG